MVLTTSMGSPGNRCRNEHPPRPSVDPGPRAMYAPFAVRACRRGLSDRKGRLEPGVGAGARTLRIPLDGRPSREG
jgi:hypothetical protein